MRAFVVSSCRKSGFRVFLSLRYGADLGRSRLVFFLKKRVLLCFTAGDIQDRRHRAGRGPGAVSLRLHRHPRGPVRGSLPPRSLQPQTPAQTGRSNSQLFNYVK